MEGCAWPSSISICPRGLLEVAWVLHKSGYSSLILGIWPWSHLSLLFITVLRYWGPSWCRPLHGLSYPWVSGGDTIDALTWWRLNLATHTPGDALSGQPVDFLPWAPWMGPTICLTLTLVNTRGRDGTQAPQSWANTCFSKKTKASPYYPRGIPLSSWRDILWAADMTFSVLKMWRFKLLVNLLTHGTILRLGMSAASASSS